MLTAKVGGGKMGQVMPLPSHPHFPLTLPPPPPPLWAPSTAWDPPFWHGSAVFTQHFPLLYKSTPAHTVLFDLVATWRIR